MDLNTFVGFVILLSKVNDIMKNITGLTDEEGYIMEYGSINMSSTNTLPYIVTSRILTPKKTRVVTQESIDYFLQFTTDNQFRMNANFFNYFKQFEIDRKANNINTYSITADNDFIIQYTTNDNVTYTYKTTFNKENYELISRRLETLTDAISNSYDCKIVVDTKFDEQWIQKYEKMFIDKSLLTISEEKGYLIKIPKKDLFKLNKSATVRVLKDYREDILYNIFDVVYDNVLEMNYVLLTVDINNL